MITEDTPGSLYPMALHSGALLRQTSLTAAWKKKRNGHGFSDHRVSNWQLPPAHHSLASLRRALVTILQPGPSSAHGPVPSCGPHQNVPSGQKLAVPSTTSSGGESPLRRLGPQQFRAGSTLRPRVTPGMLQYQVMPVSSAMAWCLSSTTTAIRMRSMSLTKSQPCHTWCNLCLGTAKFPNTGASMNGRPRPILQSPASIAQFSAGRHKPGLPSVTSPRPSAPVARMLSWRSPRASPMVLKPCLRTNNPRAYPYMVEWYTSMALGSMVVSRKIYRPTRHKSPFICEAPMVPVCSLSSTAVKAGGDGSRGPLSARMQNTLSSVDACSTKLVTSAGILRELGRATPNDWIPYAAQYATLPPIPAPVWSFLSSVVLLYLQPALLTALASYMASPTASPPTSPIPAIALETEYRLLSQRLLCPGCATLGVLACPLIHLLALLQPHFCAGDHQLVTSERPLRIIHLWDDQLCSWHPSLAGLMAFTTSLHPNLPTPSVLIQVLDTGPRTPTWLEGDTHNYEHLLQVTVPR